MCSMAKKSCRHLKTFEELFQAMKFDTFLSAEEAVEWGLADEVITKRK